MKENTLDRFIQKIDASSKHGPNGDCWKWTAYTDEWGYGRIMLDGRSALAHRVSFELFNGPVPADKLVLHKCDVPFCVNPKHLYAGTSGDNVRDAYDRKRYPTRKGRSNGNSRLKETDVLKIRSLVANRHTYKEIADKFHVTPGTVGHIVRGLTWTHLK
jgi:hypothetical protein